MTGWRKDFCGGSQAKQCRMRSRGWELGALGAGTAALPMTWKVVQDLGPFWGGRGGLLSKHVAQRCPPPSLQVGSKKWRRRAFFFTGVYLDLDLDLLD